MLYNAIIANPAPVIAAMKDSSGNAFAGDGPCFLDLTAQPGLNRWDYDLSTLTIRESLRGQACVMQVQLKTPNAGFLVAGAGQYLLVWTDFSCPAGKGRVLGCGMISPMPSSVGNADGHVDVEAYCRTLTWQLDVVDAMTAAVPHDRLFYDADSGASTADLMNASTTVPTIDRRTLAVTLRQSYAAIDVDTTKGAGNVTQGGVTAYDVTSETLLKGFDLRKGEEPIRQLSTKLQVAWNQYAAGTCDLGGSIAVALGALAGSGTALTTWTPNDMKASLPRPGSSLGTGWTCIKGNFVAVDGVGAFARATSETDVAAAIAAGYQTIGSTAPTSFADGTGYVQVPFSNISVAPGSNAGVMGWYDYTQPRRETLDMNSTLDIDARFLGGLPKMQGAKVAIADPTTPVTGDAWLPNTPYSMGDAAWWGGLRQLSLTDQVSGTTFDQTQWETEQPDPADVPALLGVYIFLPNTYYAAGTCVRPDANTNTYWYRNFSGYSPTYKSDGVTLATFSDDQANYTQGPAPSQALAMSAWQYLSSARGQTTINHLDQRHYATLLNAAKCIEATFRLRFDDVLDPSIDYRAIDLSIGKCLRVRTDALTSGVKEVIGVVQDLEITMGVNGSGAVSVVLGIIPGNGLTNAGSTTTLGAVAGSYVYSQPRVPVDVTNLGNPGYAILQVTVAGTDANTQSTLIQGAISSSVSGDVIAGNIISALGDANVNRLRLNMRGLIQEGLIPLVHPTMNMQVKAAPKNIVFS